MRRITLSILLLLLVTPDLDSQDPLKIVVVDFERAIAECKEGKAAADKFNVKFEERKKEIESKQKGLEEIETKLRTQERVLGETVKAEMTRDVDRRRIELTRLNEDAQKDLGALREQLLRPIAEKANRILTAYVKEQAITIVIDISAENNVAYFNPSIEITADLIKLIDADAKL